MGTFLLLLDIMSVGGDLFSFRWRHVNTSAEQAGKEVAKTTCLRTDPKCSCLEDVEMSKRFLWQVSHAASINIYAAEARFSLHFYLLKEQLR